MGLFSSKYQTNVATSTARVIEDSTLPNAVKHGAVRGLFQDDGDQFTENILEALVDSIGVKADRLFRYGKNNYIYGLPSSTTLVANMGKDQVQAKIVSLLGQNITLDYYHYGAFNNLHIGWMKLIENHGYNAKTNVLGVLTAAKGKPVTLTNIVVCVIEASLQEMSNGSLDIWGPSPNAGGHTTTDNAISMALLRKLNGEVKPKTFELDPSAPNDYLRVEYTWSEDYTVVTEGVSVTRQRMATGSFQIQILGFDPKAEFHHTKYTRADGEIGYWMYQAGTGVYPEIDNLHDTLHLSTGSFFPWTYFRVDGVKGTADTTSQWYKQSRRMTKYLNIDYEQVCDAIHENPDIDKVEQAMLMMSVPAVTTNQVEMRYLFDFFGDLIVATNGGDLKDAEPFKPKGFLSAVLGKALGSSINDAALVIQDSKFKLSLGFRHINKNIIQGVIGKVGHYTSGWETETIVEHGTSTPAPGTGLTTPTTWSTEVKSHWYRKQTTETQYEEIRLHNLKVKYWIYGEYAATADENDDILLIPIDRSVTQNYSIPVKEELYARSLHYIFNSKVVTEIKWYQQDFFRYLLIVAAIIITIWSWGQTWQTIGAALALGTVTIEGVIYMLAIKLIEQILIAAAIKLFVRVVGVKFALLVAIIAAIAGVYQAIDAGGLAGAPWATELLQLSTGLTKGISTELQRDFGKLQAEADAFGVFAKQEQTKLDEANKLLENSNWMTPLVIFGESPHDFYHRTVHSGNIGVLSLDAISEFVNVSLTLPKLNDTL